MKAVLSSSGDTRPEPFERPPRIAGSITCRGCFNRCTLRPGEAGTCTVKRNVGGRMTGSTLRIREIIARR